MHTETESNTQEVVSPPLPPAAVFDEQHMAEAKPVQPLHHQQSREFADGFQHISHRRVTKVATMIAGVIFCVGVGAASVDWDRSQPSSKDDTAQTASESLAPSIAPPTSNRLSVKRQDSRRRTFSPPRGREAPSFELNEEEDDQKPRPRMVSVIH